ncbi:SH3 domain containing protein [Moelleriella libera RCEF 2490]|uniref:SH3 domain containing protein n=1 Tax=Moelleriella libera RCEF 2490 TaxID=1081109 RepID=A0A168A259_9HYPO|nr:SH3 domain containing protein [Moelleriella libera RCEF 2490]
MTRPSIIRADTIDLQDTTAPSAKDHPNHSHHFEATSGALGAAVAPHQAETLRGVAQETAEAEAHSPRVSWANSRVSVADLGQKNADEKQHQASRNDKSVGDGSRIDMFQPSQHDALANAQNGGVSSADEEEVDGENEGELDDDLMDKISSSPSIEDEDIDFEFVYALHTFVATVEGQANASKGDTMVLLDDSNSYWWLVRVVKDSSIGELLFMKRNDDEVLLIEHMAGYLPAEHIETPTERLARLNKHRNIDLSASMLGDQAQKHKNSFKSMRKRKKTVTFTEPTYVDYSDFDYSTDDEDIEELFGSHPNGHQQQQQQQQQLQQQENLQQEQQRALDGTGDLANDENAKVEPLKTRPHPDHQTASQFLEESQAQNGRRGSDDALEETTDGPSRSRNGTVRNTDSFFKDETVETKKITLTPNLLRDDDQTRQSTDSATKDTRSGSSLEKMDRELLSDKEKKKLKDRDKKDKDKKSGGLRGFFSRKDKKKSMDDDDESFGKRSMDIVESRESEDRSIEESLSSDRSGLQKHSSKLHKSGPASKTHTNASQKSVELSSYLAEGRANDVSNVPPASMRIVEPGPNEAPTAPSSHQSQPPSRDIGRDRFSPNGSHKEELSTNAKLVPSRSASADPESRPQKTVKAKAHSDLNSSSNLEGRYNPIVQSFVTGSGDSSNEQYGHNEGQAARSTLDSEQRGVLPAAAKSDPQSAQVPSQGMQAKKEETSLTHGIQPPALVVDTSSTEGVSPEASPSPEPMQVVGDVARAGSAASGGKDATWDDTKLHAFFGESDHIRDLLVVVYDKTNVEPAGNDHPVVGGLFREQNAKLAEITTQLDNMLGDWLARKQRLRGTI